MVASLTAYKAVERVPVTRYSDSSAAWARACVGVGAGPQHHRPLRGGKRAASLRRRRCWCADVFPQIIHVVMQRRRPGSHGGMIGTAASCFRHSAAFSGCPGVADQSPRRGLRVAMPDRSPDALLVRLQFLERPHDKRFGFGQRRPWPASAWPKPLSARCRRGWKQVSRDWISGGRIAPRPAGA